MVPSSKEKRVDSQNYDYVLSAIALIGSIVFFVLAIINPSKYGPVFLVISILTISTMRLVAQNHVAVVEILGKYTFSWTEGPHFLIPVLMTIRSRVPIAQSPLVLRLDGVWESEDGKKHSEVDLVNDSVKIDAIITIIVKDAFKAVYDIGAGVSDYKELVISKVESEIRTHFARLTVGEAIEEKGRKVKKDSFKDLQDAFEPWGVELKETIIRDVELSNQALQTRREKLQADVNVYKTLAQAEADKKADIKRGIGEGTALQKASEKSGLSVKEIAAVKLTEKQFEALKEGTLFVNTGEGGLNIPLAVAEANEVLDTMRSKKDAKKKSKIDQEGTNK